MTSRLFLNLRSAGSSTPNSLQPQAITTLFLDNRKATPPESDQSTSGPVALDTTLFAIATDVERGGFSDQEQMHSWDTAETQSGEESSRGDAELRPRGG
jgi:hypothetical protein